MQKKEKTEQKKGVLLNIIFIVITLLLLGIPIYLVAQRVESFSELKQIFSSVDQMREFVESFGATAPVIFFLLQTFQVIAAPIPGNVTALVGGALFGFWKSFLITIAGLAVGSSIAFLLVRLYGRPLVERFVKPQIIDKYLDSGSKKYSLYLFLLFLVPFFPDDALCFVAGLTGISYKTFILIVIIARPPGLAFSSLVGSGAISIPWWGWTLIGITAAAFIFCSVKYGEKIENWLIGKIKKVQG
ncbi:MAG: TVP38/TMEM64 family protein [Ruminiclostridium sp.]|nr:TVP38/TMEM64 family protein [Ruminiclostridium sp.]